MLPVPFCVSEPERQYRLDPFHICKVGIYRDLAGSCLMYLVHEGYYGSSGDFPSKLETAHMHFKMFCKVEGRTPALRSFSRQFFMYPRFDTFPWSNSKGADTMILIAWLATALTGFINDPLDPGHVPTLELMRATCRSATETFRCLNGHGLWLERECAMLWFAHHQAFIRGFQALAGSMMNAGYSLFGIKPKLHLWRHESLVLQEALANGDQRIQNCISRSCEANEDQIGRVSRLSRRYDSKTVIRRCLQGSLMKASIVHKRFKKNRKL